jgi:FtsP/CotA-like multicopper oxidase with cupredoxin domain
VFWQNAYFIALAFLIIIIFSSLNAPFIIPAYSQIAESHISQVNYDKIKNCATDLSKKPSSVEYLTHFNCGHVSNDQSGSTVREFTLIVQEHQNIPISYEGHMFEGWTFNGTIPGPTMRVTEGDSVRIRIINTNDNTHGHSFYTQPIHYAKNNIISKSGYPGATILPGKSFTYEFVAGPYGVYPYYCHEEPMADHMNRGLYGMMIIDPRDPRPQMTEMAMLLNGYDLDLDMEGSTTLPPIAQLQDTKNNITASSDSNNTNIGTNMSNLLPVSLPSNEEQSASVVKEKRGNEIYTVNGRAFDYMMNPIVLYTGKPYRVYVINMLEFDPVNSIHIHGAMFDYYSAGTNKTSDYLTDIVTLVKGDRGIMEFTYPYPGTYMFHAHQTVFTDLGWMGLFDVRGNPVNRPTGDANVNHGLLSLPTN